MIQKTTCCKLFVAAFIFGVTACTGLKKPNIQMKNDQKGSYGYDAAFLKKHTKPVELKSGEARVLLSPEYQGRVMTSSASGESGLSFGWINHELIASGEVLAQINPVGGEERFWLGPEGGQYSIFFKEGASFDFANWATPACLDTETFEVLAANDTSAVFAHSVRLKNYGGFEFIFDAERKVTLLDVRSLENELGISLGNKLQTVGYRTENSLKNTGSEDWKKESGLLSIWMLGMFNPSDEITIMVPYKTDAESDYIVKDDYFGKIPGDRLVVNNGLIFFKGDGQQRGKIGVPPQRALPVIGSYDAVNRVLTVLKCDLPEGVTDYVNSAWELQDEPFKGDAINSYNDGPLEDGSQMGPFYELETSSPALALKVGETAVHTQSTVHFQGEENELDDICKQLFGVSLEEIKNAF